MKHIVIRDVLKFKCLNFPVAWDFSDRHCLYVLLLLAYCA